MTLQEMKPKVSRKEERKNSRRKRNRLVVLVVAVLAAAAFAAYFLGLYSPPERKTPVENFREAYSPTANEQPPEPAEPVGEEQAAQEEQPEEESETNVYAATTSGEVNES